MILKYLAIFILCFVCGAFPAMSNTTEKIAYEDGSYALSTTNDSGDIVDEKTYSAEGQLLDSVVKNAAGVTTEIMYENGLPTYSVESDPTSGTEVETQYDSQGRLFERVTYDDTGLEIKSEKFDVDGNAIKGERVDEVEDRLGAELAASGVETYVDEPWGDESYIDDVDDQFVASDLGEDDLESPTVDSYEEIEMTESLSNTDSMDNVDSLLGDLVY